jgi:hypothetical protein
VALLVLGHTLSQIIPKHVGILGAISITKLPLNRRSTEAVNLYFFGNKYFEGVKRDAPNASLLKLT